MGVRILEGDTGGGYRNAVLYCSTTDWAFGPLFEDADEAQAFLDWLGVTDPRTLADNELATKVSQFRVEHEETKKQQDKKDRLRHELLQNAENTAVEIGRAHV